MLDDVASASTPADPSKEGYVFKGWGEAVTDDTACTVTYTAQWEEEPTDPDPEEPTDPDPEDPTDPDPEDPTDPDPEDPTDPDPEDPTDPDPEDPTDPDPEDPSDTDDDTDSPGTADSAELWIWASLTLVCAGAVITLTVRRRKQTV